MSVLHFAHQAWTALTKRDQAWHDLLRQVGLDIDETNENTFKLSLEGEIDVNRQVPGFEDFAAEGIRGVEPGWPARSLLYHALASPSVTHYNQTPLAVYPTEDEIDAIENYVYGVHPPTVARLRASAGGAPLAIAVFAYEYRPAAQTVHRKHADLCFSRTGVARIGNKEALYLGPARGYLPFVQGVDSTYDIRVTPCRYAAFIAAGLKGDEARFGPMRFQTLAGTPTTGPQSKSDADRSFWVPLHKLFDGGECIGGQPDLEVNLEIFHLNEKLRRVHMVLHGMGFASEVRKDVLDNPPFRFWNDIAERRLLGLARPAATAANQTCSTILVVPKDQPFVQLVEYGSSPLSFRLPPIPRVLGSSFHLQPPDFTNRACPEFVNCSTKITEAGKAHDISKSSEYIAEVESGGFDVLHMRDFTGDGYVKAECAQLREEIPENFSAYSIVAPPDFLPLVTQKDLADWFDNLPGELQTLIWSSADVNPEPLSDARLPANLEITGAGFRPDDDTISAIVSSLGSRGGTTVPYPGSVVRGSGLPDDAAGLFAPGWDTSQDVNRDHVQHLSAYGLGSPFPEDVKLCAALSAFWPAAAPDTTRFYPQTPTYPTTSPFPDKYAGWDGLELPREEQPGNSSVFVYNSLGFADYVGTALANRFRMDLLSTVTFEDYTEWTLVMTRVHMAFGAKTQKGAARWHLPHFNAVPADDPELLRAIRESGAQMSPAGVYKMLVFKGRQLTARPRDKTKVRVGVDEKHWVLANSNTVLVQDPEGRWSEKK